MKNFEELYDAIIDLDDEIRQEHWDRCPIANEGEESVWRELEEIVAKLHDTAHRLEAYYAWGGNI
jgi:hypothetical protein